MIRFKRYEIILFTIISMLIATSLCSISYGYRINDNGDDVTYGKKATLKTNVMVRSDRIGNYEAEINAYEIPFRETLPYNVVSKSYFPSTKKVITTKIDNLAPVATYQTHSLVKVDVVFAVGNTDQAEDLQRYIPTFTAKLGAAENFIDAYVEQIETSEVDMQAAFSWVRDVRTTIGNININPTGTTVSMTGNRSLEGKNAIYIESPQNILKQKFSFNYNVTFGDSFSAAGVLFNIGKVGSQLKGYAVVFKNSGGSFNNHGIYEVTYNTGTNGSKFGTSNVKLLKNLNISNSGTLTLEMEEDTVRISGGGLSRVEEVNLDKNYGFGLGFFSEHYSHSCDRIGSFNLTNLKLEKTEAKNLGASLEDVSWRDDATRVIIHATDLIPTELQNGAQDSGYLLTLTKLLSNNAYLLNMGVSSNETALRELGNKLTSTDGINRSHFINNNCKNKELNTTGDPNKNITNSMDAAIEWIKTLIHTEDDEALVKWLLVNETMQWSTTYSDSEHDVPLNFNKDDLTKSTISSWAPKTVAVNYNDAKILAEKWRFKHFKGYFDQSFTDADFNNVWIEDPITSFSLPGKYRVNYKRRDNPFYTDVAINSAFDEYRKWSVYYDGRTSFTDEDGSAVS